ncbi:MAG: PD40 domain-containing protein [Bdellovibrionaceae bacterium]|nr:PD40 domain-containing protein [Pseudobdellovibrionaceae bacterium]
MQKKLSLFNSTTLLGQILKGWIKPQILFSLFLLGTPTLHAEPDTAYINVGQASVKKSLAAITPLEYLGTPSLAKAYLKYEKELQDIIEKDLTIVSYFTIQDPSAFLEHKKGLRPYPVDSNGFDFKSWSSIGTEFLIKTGFNITDNKIMLDTYVYDINQRSLVLGRSYNAPLKDLRGVGHKFCNDLIEKLSGKKAFFMSKLLVSRSTSKTDKEIFMMDWDGANQQQITQKHSIAVSPSWSSDGRYIAYSVFNFHTKAKTRNADLYLQDLKTGKKTIISAVKGLNTTASFFPDMSAAIIRVSPSNGTSDLYKLPFNGGKREQLTQGPRGAMNVEPALSPDAKNVAFSSDRSGKAMIYIKDLASNQDRRLTFAGQYNASPAWSPDGKQIAFAAHIDNHFDIYIMDVDGKNLRRLTDEKQTGSRRANNEDPSFSPDGRLILFRSNRTGHYQLYAITVDGKNEYRLTFDKYDYYRPQWSPFLN